jgi:CBS-domain-containing membrane protein
MRNRLKLLNVQFREHWLRFVTQTLMIVVFMFFVMMALIFGEKGHQLDVLTAIGASSLSASAFIVFALPSGAVAQPHRVLVSYVIAMVCGVSWHFFIPYIGAALPITSGVAACFGSALAAGCTMLLMAAFDFEHPPAMGLSVGLAMDVWDWWTLCVVLVGILVLCFAKYVFRGWLINLL